MHWLLPMVSTAVTAQVDACEVVGPSTHPTWPHYIELQQTSDFGDAQAEQLFMELIYGFTVSGSGGNSSVAAPGPTGMATFGGTCETWNTTLANTGTPRQRIPMMFSAQGRNCYIYTPLTSFPIEVSERCVLRVNAPADSLTMHGAFAFAPWRP